MILAITGCGEKDTPKKTESKASTEEKKEEPKEENQTFAIGDRIEFKNVAFTITDIKKTDYRSEFEDESFENVIVVTYSVENLGDEDYTVGSDISLYVDGKKAATYPVENITLDTISGGRTFEGAVAGFGYNGSGDLELEIAPLFSFDSEKAILKFALE